jgi:hypothetical protein
MPIPLAAGWIATTLLPLLLSGVMWLFRSKLGFFILMAFVWLGINFATLNLVIEPTIQQLQDFGQMADGGGGGGTGENWGALAKAWAGVMNLDKAISMIISAVVTKHAAQQARLFLTKVTA